jgi:putative hydrolase of the HAD superfamily
MITFDMVAFDADDTLWYYERLYAQAQAKIATLLAPFSSPEEITAYLSQVEMENLQVYGYGIKGFALSMIEASIQLSRGNITSQEIQILLNETREMLSGDIQLVPRVNEVLLELSVKCPLMIITKGDLFEQESKISRSGLDSYFQHVEIVSSKSSHIYTQILRRYKLVPERFMMVGNSLRSDILPVLEIGAHAVYIPGEITWVHEVAEAPPSAQTRFYQLENLKELSPLLAQIERG